MSTGGVATLPSGIGSAGTCFDSGIDSGPIEVFYLQNLDATNYACFQVQGRMGSLQYGTGKIVLPPNSGLIPVRIGQNQNGITKILGWGEDPSGDPAADVKAIGFVGARV
jgi:hypothetical protein